MITVNQNQEKTYTPLTPSSVIFDELKKLEEKESELMSRILG